MTTATLILPRFRDNGKGASFEPLLADFQDYITRQFGGCYTLEATGHWHNGQCTITEPVAILRIAYGATGQQAARLVLIAECALVEFGQSQIFLDLGGAAGVTFIRKGWNETHTHKLRRLARNIRNRPWVTMEEQQVAACYS